jgi:hypothetical protein
LRRRRCRQRRRQNDQHDHRGFAHHCHRIKPPHALASWPLIQFPVVTCERPLGVAQGPKTCRATRGGTQEQMRRDIPGLEWPMSALGQKRTCAAHKPMSALCQ